MLTSIILLDQDFNTNDVDITNSMVFEPFVLLTPRPLGGNKTHGPTNQVRERYSFLSLRFRPSSWWAILKSMIT